LNEPARDFRQRNRLEAGLLNKTSRLAAALGVTKFIAILVINLVTLFKSDLDVNKPTIFEPVLAEIASKKQAIVKIFILTNGHFQSNSFLKMKFRSYFSVKCWLLILTLSGANSGKKTFAIQ
jgi:hypothetical protein